MAGRPAGEPSGTSVDGGRHQGVNVLALALADESAHLRAVVGGQADPDAAGELGDPCADLVVDRAVHEDPGSGDTALTALHEVRVHGRRDREIEVGVLEHDDGALAAQLQHHRHEVGGRLPDHGSPGLDAAGERQHADRAVLHQHRSDDVAAASDDVEHAWRDARFQRPARSA